MRPRLIHSIREPEARAEYRAGGDEEPEPLRAAVIVELERLQLLRIADVMKVLALSERTVYRLIKSGELRSVRIGNAVRVPAAAVAELIEAAQEKSA